MPAIIRPRLMTERLDTAATSTSSGTRPTRATRVPTEMEEVVAARAPEQRARGQRGPVGPADRPQMVEAEHPVEPELFGSSGGLEGGVGLVAELREGDADLHGVAFTAVVDAARWPRPSCRCRRAGGGHAVDSTRAFSSRRAIDMMRLWARILMNPGSGTFISTSRW